VGHMPFSVTPKFAPRVVAGRVSNFETRASPSLFVQKKESLKPLIESEPKNNKKARYLIKV
jgi:hypothetical protein